MNELIGVGIIVAIAALLMWVYKRIMVRHTKMKLGIIQVLADGAVVESMNHEINPSSDLPFNGNIIASFFASFLVMRESGVGANYYGLLSMYLFKWELAGIIKTKMITDAEVHLTFDDTKRPTTEVELELYEILKANDMFGAPGMDVNLLHDWSKKMLALGEAQLLETKDVAFDSKDRIRFTRQGYDKSLGHGSFEKYFRDISFSTFCEMDAHQQERELSFALLLGLIEEIEAHVNSNQNVPEVLQIANRVARVL